MWRIRAGAAACAAVKIMGVGIRYADSMAPHKSRYPTTSPSRKLLNLKGRTRGDKGGQFLHNWPPLRVEFAGPRLAPQSTPQDALAWCFCMAELPTLDLHYAVTSKPLARRTLRVSVDPAPYMLARRHLLRRTDPVYDHFRAALVTTGTMEFPPRSSTEVPKQHSKPIACRVRRRGRLTSNVLIRSAPAARLRYNQSCHAGSLQIRS